VRVRSLEGSVEHISFDDAAVLKGLSGFTLKMAVSFEESTELLERSVNRGAFRSSRGMRLPKANNPRRSESGNISDEVNAQSSNLT
jgi:hypothetical protein